MKIEYNESTLGGFIMLALLVFFVCAIPIVFGEKEDDEYCDDVGNNHGDTSESKSKFYKQLKTHEFCDFVKNHDQEEIKGEIREDSKHDWDFFTQTKVWKTAPEEAKFCMLERYDLPNDGKKTLGGYEIEECGTDGY